jgi:ATP-binding cassette, subfamily B, bacterial PglK
MDKTNLPSLLLRLWHHLNRRRQRQFGLLLLLMLVSAFAEVVSLGAVLPFLGILTSPDLVFDYPGVKDVAKTLGITSPNQLVFPLTVAFVSVALLAGAIRILYLWFSQRIAFSSGCELGAEAYRRTLYQPYQVHVGRNSSKVISVLTNRVSGVVTEILFPALNLINSSVLVIAILIALIAIKVTVGLLVMVSFGAAYGLITWRVQHRLMRNSRVISHEQTQVIKALQEGLGGVRDVLLDGTQSVYCDIYRQADRPLRRAQGSTLFIGGCPRFAMEVFGITLIALLAYHLSIRFGGFSNVIPALGALVLGAQRLLPALQQSYAAWSTITGAFDSLLETIELLEQPIYEDLQRPAPAPFTFKNSVRFDGVRFRYHSDGPWVLDDFNLTIPKGARVGFVGSTGSGKTTTLDVLMGLLPPNEGKFLVDDQPLTGDRIRAWQRIIAHVPQSIFLADSTLAENIALGIPLEAIDMDRVRQAAQQAQIADFIESKPEGYNALVGERGIRLSGGQCQRIGIARALYKQTRVLVFDEATSSLDNATEQSVMSAIDGLNREFTILIIAHRIATLRQCNIIVELENGRVVAQGTYQHLLECSPSFQKLVRIGEMDH